MQNGLFLKPRKSVYEKGPFAENRFNNKDELKGKSEGLLKLK